MVHMNLEVDIIPVADVERSKQFYGRLGWRLDNDVAPAKEVRIVQFTPPGSGCSVTFGKGITAAAPGSGAGGPSRSPITNSPAVASRRVRCGTARRSRRRPGLEAPTLSARATGRSSPSTIPTAIHG
jgi:catechol 2,3-dioxygenase-like lactoylglutathione lyase family enzyme